MAYSVKVFISLLGGLVPALFWLWFWLKEDRLHPEPKRKLFYSFVVGALAVFLVLPIEKFIYSIAGSQINSFTLVLWAAAEELLKFLACYFVALRTRDNDEPVDSIIYMITTALGFSALENTLFLLNPIGDGLLTQSIISGNMRFIGATLLHTASSATIGLFLALGFYKNKEIRKLSLGLGLALAIILHTTFNSFIINAADNIFYVFGGLWLAIVLLILIFEKVKTIRQ